MAYKQFNVDNSGYIFCVEDFEICKIQQGENIENVLQEIKTEKEKSNATIDKNERANIENDFMDGKIINTIGIDIAHGCTLDCTYCYVSASKKSLKLLNTEKFLDILKFLKNVKNNHITFYFTGYGEPALNFNLLKQIPYLCKKNGFNKCDFDLTANGTILTNEMIEFFKLNKFTIYISVDGNEKINDESRIYHNGKGSFKDVFHNMNLLKENNIKFSCKTVVLPDNKNLVETFLFFEQNKIHFIFTIATNSFDNHFSPNTEDLKTFEEQLDTVIDNYRKLIEDNHKIYSTKIINDLKRIHYGAVNKNGCVASKEGYFIDIDGNIFPCSYHSSSIDLSVGNIYTGIDYEKILKNNYYAKPVDNYPTCKVCWMKYLCSGSCFAIKWLENKNTEEPSEYLCKTYNIYWSAMIKLYIQLHPVIISGNNINFHEWKN
ncbi:MAG: radical SAM protein [Prevotellaceae bacterium]|nr:radical SAM protein [Prevotellaceae bacterium]